MKREWATQALIAANVTVLALMVASGVDVLEPDTRSLLAWGANYAPLTVGAREWWRLFAAVFIHGGVIHLAFNMYALWMGGRLVERVFGHAGFVVLYAFAGIAGSVSSIVVHPSVPTVGASGAIFGVFGALLAFLLRRRTLLPSAALKRLRVAVLAMIVFNVLFGFAVPEIDQAGHLGGLLGGFLAGLALAPAFEHGVLKRPWIVYPIVLAAGAVLVTWIATY
jgi:rhomboid protease GluP